VMYKKLKHKLFNCPTFWRLKPSYQCPKCLKKYRCYWDGNDIEGVGIHYCDKCAAVLEGEVNGWWQGLDPHDQDTWVECLAWDDEGDFKFRVLVKNRFKDSTGKYRFDVAMGSPYDHATPYLKPVGVK